MRERRRTEGGGRDDRMMIDRGRSRNNRNGREGEKKRE